MGYSKDRFAGEALREINPEAHQAYKADQPSKFLPMIFAEATGLDGKKLGAVQQRLEAARKELGPEASPEAAFAKLSPADRTVLKASIEGDRKTLRADSFIPAGMAVIYLILALWFRAIGGYRRVTIGEDEADTGPAAVSGSTGRPG